MLSMTRHAQARCRQRGIPPSIVEHLLDFGNEVHDHRGACVVFFDHRARERLRSLYGHDGFKRIEPHLKAYAVVADDGAIVTVGHRRHRINH
jgi:hypothetical protein